MGLNQAIRQNIRQFRTIPPGSILWLDIPGANDLIESHALNSLSNLMSVYGNPERLVVHLDTPDGDFEDSFDIDIADLKCPPVPVPRVNSATSSRNAVIDVYGLKVIETVETLVPHYTGILLGKFRRRYGYTGPVPDIKVKWHTKHSWGGWKGITISPGYLYALKSTYYSIYFREYSHIDKLPNIGGFYSCNRLNHIKALVAHELAHFLQRHTNQACLPSLDYRTPHGEGWQYLYSITRKDLNRILQR